MWKKSLQLAVNTMAILVFIPFWHANTYGQFERRLSFRAQQASVGGLSKLVVLVPFSRIFFRRRSTAGRARMKFLPFPHAVVSDRLWKLEDCLIWFAFRFTWNLTP